MYFEYENWINTQYFDDFYVLFMKSNFFDTRLISIDKTLSLTVLLKMYEENLDFVTEEKWYAF